MAEWATLFAPPDSESVTEFCRRVGVACAQEAKWTGFADSLMQVGCCFNVGLLKAMRGADVEQAAAQAEVGAGFINVLKEVLSAEGAPPHNFVEAVLVGNTKVKITGHGSSEKKFDSQKGLPTISRLIGADAISELTLPEMILSGLSYSKQVAFKSKGKNSVAVVADRIFQWIVGTYGVVHVDLFFAERIEELLNAEIPKLEPWGKTPRTWSKIILNRFMNSRGSSYTHCVSIPDVDLCERGKALLESDGARFASIKEEAPSMFKVDEKTAQKEMVSLPCPACPTSFHATTPCPLL